MIILDCNFRTNFLVYAEVSLQTSGNCVYHIILAHEVALHGISVLSYRLKKWFWEKGSNWKRL